MEKTRYDKLIFFAYNGSGPFDCFFCGTPVELPWLGVGQVYLNERFTVHHHHEDDKLVPTHNGCHKVYHLKVGGNGITLKGYAAIAEKNRGRKHSVETKRRLRDGFKRHPKDCKCAAHSPHLRNGQFRKEAW